MLILLHLYKIHAMADGSRTSSAASAAKRTSVTPNWLLPSAADLIFIAVLSALAFTALSVRLLGDAGIGWHIRTGQQILATHTVPHFDSFSASTAGKHWFAWEWLYDVTVGGLDTIAGLNAVVWFTAIVIAAVFGWMFRLLILRGTSLFFALLLVLLSMWASMIHFLARPHVLSWLFTLAWFWILDSTERASFQQSPHRRQRRLWLLPILMLLWVNLHGGFLLGFALLALYWLASLWTWAAADDRSLESILSRTAARSRAVQLTFAGIVSLAVSFVNPYGWKLYHHLYAYLNDRFLMDHIDEFQSPNFHKIAEKSFLILLLIAIAVMIARGRSLRLSNVLVALFALYAGLTASRNLPISAILLTMVAGPLLQHTGYFTDFSERMTAVELRMRGHLWPALAALVTFLIALNGGRLGSAQAMNAHFGAQRMPVAAVNYLKSHDVQGPILSPDYWGGYLIYRLYPRAQVVVDDRHDLYGPDFFKSYVQMLHVEQGWQDFLRDHPARCVLLPRNSALTNILLETRGWRVIYTDDLSIAFVPDAERSHA